MELQNVVWEAFSNKLINFYGNSLLIHEEDETTAKNKIEYILQFNKKKKKRKIDYWKWKVLSVIFEKILNRFEQFFCSEATHIVVLWMCSIYVEWKILEDLQDISHSSRGRRGRRMKEMKKYGDEGLRDEQMGSRFSQFFISKFDILKYCSSSVKFQMRKI